MPASSSVQASSKHKKMIGDKGVPTVNAFPNLRHYFTRNKKDQSQASPRKIKLIEPIKVKFSDLKTRNKQVKSTKVKFTKESSVVFAPTAISIDKSIKKIRSNKKKINTKNAIKKKTGTNYKSIPSKGFKIDEKTLAKSFQLKKTIDESNKPLDENNDAHSSATESSSIPTRLFKLNQQKASFYRQKSLPKCTFKSSILIDHNELCLKKVTKNSKRNLNHRIVKKNSSAKSTKSNQKISATSENSIGKANIIVPRQNFSSSSLIENGKRNASKITKPNVNNKHKRKIMQVKNKLNQVKKNESTSKGGKNMSSGSPEPKGTLTPPGSSPIRAFCSTVPQFSHGSTPSSPETPMTPDSAYMTAETTNHNDSFALEMGEEKHSTNIQEPPLTGAKKRKATKTHKVETPECLTRLESDSLAASGLTCSVCQTVMTSQHDFTRHIRTHNRVIEDESNGTKLFECGLCRKTLSSNSSLDRHMLVHSGERPFRCHICGTHFTTNGNMHRHIRGHFRNGGAGSDTGDSSDAGSDGDVMSPSGKRKHEGSDNGIVSIKIPRLINFKNEELEFDCPICGAEYDEQSSLQFHLEKEHPSDNKLSLITNIQIRSSTDCCDSSESSNSAPEYSVANKFLPILSPSSSAAQAIINKTKELSESPQHFVQRCGTCSLTFSSIEEWVLHLRIHPALRCNACNITFDSMTEYNIHQHQHAREFELKHQTSQPSSSLFPHGLPLHINGNHNLSSFGSAESLKSLFPNLPSLSVPRPSHQHFSAQQSPLDGSQNSSGLSHDEQFARDYRDMKLNGQYPCRLCKEVFANLRKLKSHNLVHMITPPYQCNLCSFVSNDKNTLKEHMKNHKGDTPYECSLCSLSFTTKANCERHIKNIHGRQTREEVKRCMIFTPQEDGPSSHEGTIDTICNVCNLDCKSRSVLRDHLRSSHPDGLDKPFACKICKLTFQSNGDAGRHIIQIHQGAVSSSNSLDSLIESHSTKEEPSHDLSSVASLLKVALPSPLQQDSPVSHGLSVTYTPKNVPAFPGNSPVVPPTLNIPTYIPTLTTSDAPLDLSISKRKRDEDSDEEEITVIDDEENEEKKCDIKPFNLSIEKIISSSKAKADLLSPSGTFKEDSISDSSSPPVSKDETSPFPLMYPHALSVQLYPFQNPFFMNQFRYLPPAIANVGNLQLLEQYQKEIKRGLHLTSGGSLLNPENSNFLPSVSESILNASKNQFFNSNASSLHQFSTLALASAKKEQQNCSDDDSVSADISIKKLPTDLSVNRDSAEELNHFAMRNSVLVKKPKQRRYRTERPWRCDLCDKGFTLRSNMERHMKQQHPDLWQQRPRGTSTPRLGSSANCFTPLQDSLNQSMDSTKNDSSSESNLKVEEAGGESEDENRAIEEEENELVIDDEEDDEEEDENIDDQEIRSAMKYENNSNADLASVPKLLSTATSQCFPFFNQERDSEMSPKSANSSPTRSNSPTSSHETIEDGKRSAYSSAPQKQKCPFCHRKFPWSSSLVRHIRTHTGQKPYLCPVCHFPFTTKSNCDRHLQRKHPTSPQALAGDRPYRCNKCPGAAFTSVESLRKHEMFKHEKEAENYSREEAQLYANDSPNKPFACHFCEMRHDSSKEVLQHIAEIHSDELGSFNFDNCSLTLDDSKNKDASENETSNAIDLEKTRCMLCPKMFTNFNELKDHMNNHHKKTLPSTEEDKPKKVIDVQSDKESSCPENLTTESSKPEEKEPSDFISKMLGTQPAVIDHLLSSKSTADAAKLLGVR